MVARLGGGRRGHRAGRCPLPRSQVDDIAVGVFASLVCFALFGLYRAPSHGTRSAAAGPAAQAIAVAAVTVTGFQAVVGNAAPGLSVGRGRRRFRRRHHRPLLLRRLAHRLPAPGPLPDPGRGGGDRARHRGARRVPRPQPRGRLPRRRRPWAGARGRRAPERRRRAEPVESVAPPCPWLGGYDDAVAAVRQTGAAGVLVAVNHIPSGALQALLHEVSAIGLPVHLSSGLTGFAYVPAAHHAGGPRAVPGAEPLQHSATQRAVKRTIDLVVVVAGAGGQPARCWRPARARHQAERPAARCCSARSASGRDGAAVHAA